MRKHLFLCAVIIASAALVSACGKKDPQNNIALEGADQARSVTDFTHFNETELPPEETETETEEMTELIVHEIPSRPVEIPTPETEEPETDPPETEYSMEYDFSEETVLSAVLTDDAVSERDVTQDQSNNTRTVKIITVGGKVITFTGNAESGSTYGSIAIDLPAGNEDQMKTILTSFDNGITDENIEKFMDGEYNGNGPLLGLADASIQSDETGLHVTLTKNIAGGGAVPGWEDGFSADIGGSIGSTKFTGDDLLPVIQSLELSQVSGQMNGEEGSSVTKKYDGTGNLISASVQMSGSYSTGSHTYDVSLSDGNLKISAVRDDCTEPHTIMMFSDRIYRWFYSGMIDQGYDLNTGDFINDHCSVHKTDDGFEIVMHASDASQEEIMPQPEGAQETTATETAPAQEETPQSEITVPQSEITVPQSENITGQSETQNLQSETSVSDAQPETVQQTDAPVDLEAGLQGLLSDN